MFLYLQMKLRLRRGVGKLREKYGYTQKRPVFTPYEFNINKEDVKYFVDIQKHKMELKQKEKENTITPEEFFLKS